MLKPALSVFLMLGLISGLVSTPAQAVATGNIACSGGGYFKVEFKDNEYIVSPKPSGEQTEANRCRGTAIVPEGITKIDDQAFNGESLMTNISLPDTLTVIGGNGLAWTGLSSINLPPNLVTLRQGALQFNKYLTSLIIPPKVAVIDTFLVFGSSGLCEVFFLGITAPTTASGAFARACETPAFIPGGAAGVGPPKGYVPVGAGSTYPAIDSDFGGLTVKNGGAILLFDANGADSGSLPPTQVLTPGTEITVAGNIWDLRRLNYRFIGWCTSKLDDGSGVCFEEGDTVVVPNGTTILYVNWQGKPRVTYEANGATGGNVPVDASSPYEENSTVTVLPNNTGANALTRTGYTFGGWATAADGTGTVRQAGATFNIGTENAKLYAKWNANTYGLIYDRNWGSGTGTGFGLGPIPNLYESTVTVADKPANLTKTGYDFVGWNTKADGTGTDRAAGSTFTMGAENTWLYAKWTPKSFGVYYSGNGNTSGFGMGPNPHVFDSTVTVRDNENSLAKTGHDFAGWNTKADGTGDSRAVGSTFTMGAESVELFAQWNPKSFNVTYNGNENTGGSAPIDDLSPRNYGTSVPVLGAGSLVQDGFRFNGWNTLADGTGIPYSPESSFTLEDADVVLYAQWANWAEVTYFANGATKGSVPSDNSVTFGSTVTVSTNSGGLAKPGFKFVGWNTEADGSGTSYAATGSITFVMPEDEVSLYAMWEAIPAPSKPVIKETTASAVSIKIRFQYGSSVISNANRKAIKKAVAKGGVDAMYVITAGVGDIAGVSSKLEKKLAKNRAKAVTSEFVKLGVKKKNIKVVLKVYRPGETPKTKIISKLLTS